MGGEGPHSSRWAGRGHIWTQQTLPSGYPNEEAAEVVLAALREWLEQHKDKVSRERMVGGEAGSGAPGSGQVRPVRTCPPQTHSLRGLIVGQMMGRGRVCSLNPSYDQYC